ncbi:MAG: HEPN domain-containing protein [Elusimicrobia bacterium]|nr:HEPN domain-containing protein [Candidatus Liberimonas magnetica]
MDIADKDYLAARICYRYDLPQEFLWLSLQAIEKYIKAILLYNEQETKSIGHDISKAYDKMKSLKEFSFDIPKDVESFISYLNRYGLDRYFEKPYFLYGEELLSLDRTVWFIRRYCGLFNSKIKKIDGTMVDGLSANLKRIQNPYYLKQPNKFIHHGYLGHVLNNKRLELRKQLVYKNFYFGTYKRKLIKNYKLKSGSGTPTHIHHKEIFDELKAKVRFSKEIIDHFKN